MRGAARPRDNFVSLSAYKNVIHKQNYSEHFGKGSDLKCPVEWGRSICRAKDLALFPVFPTGKL